MCTCIDVSAQTCCVSLFRLLFLCVRMSTHWCMPVGKGGLQGLCKWVCVQYMCVIMGMWWYKCGVCITCMSISVCVCVSMFVCGLHMLPITSPICVNHHRRRNRERHSDYDLKDIREEGEPVTGPARPRCQTNFTHTSFAQFAHALH